MKDYGTILNIFAQRLRELMNNYKGHKISMAELSRMTNIPRTTINSWLLENKMPTIYYAYRIAEFFGVSLDYLTGRKDFE